MCHSTPVGRATAVALLALCCAGAGAVAEERGRAVAMSGGPAGLAAACARCHGEDGSGDAAALAPPLSGQDPLYLYKQLADYASGARPNAVMSPVAKSLSPEDWAAAVGYFAGKRGAQIRGGPGSAIAARLVAQGDWERGIPSCGSCHEAGTETRPQASPLLDGLFAGYTAYQLRLWRDGTRTNDPMHRMAAIARRLTDAEIDAIAAYYALRPAIAEIGR